LYNIFTEFGITTRQ